MLYKNPPIADSDIALINPVFSSAGLNKDIMARTIHIKTRPAINPYIIPPVLSTCFKIGNSVMNFNKKLTIVKIILAIMNNTIAEPA